jgi:anti-sigma B factor antagonist
MGIEITARHEGNVTVLDAKGRMTTPEECLLRDSVHEALEAGSSRILVRLREVNVIDSSGVGELVAALSTVTKEGGELKLLDPSPKVLDVLEVTGLPSVFEIFRDESEAIASFAPG